MHVEGKASFDRGASKASVQMRLGNSFAIARLEDKAFFAAVQIMSKRFHEVRRICDNGFFLMDKGFRLLIGNATFLPIDLIDGRTDNFGNTLGTLQDGVSDEIVS